MNTVISQINYQAVLSKPGVFSQIITNLVINAQVHAFESSKVGDMAITITKENQMIQVIFDDNGIGMSEEVRE